MLPGDGEQSVCQEVFISLGFSLGIFLISAVGCL